MRARLASHDWSASPLGERGRWPVELRVALELMLDSPHPTMVCWSGRFLMLYNDAYAALLGAAHPAALGRPLSEAVPGLWPDVAPLAAAAMAGRPGQVGNWCAPLPGDAACRRRFSAAYAPLRSLEGEVGGFVHTAFETTAGAPGLPGSPQAGDEDGDKGRDGDGGAGGAAVPTHDGAPVPGAAEQASCGVAGGADDTGGRKRGDDDMRRLAREASDASRRKSEFLAVLAHELRNPMATIRTGLEIMRLRADSPDTLARVREMLERQIQQLSHLVDDLLDIARVSSGKIEIRRQLADLNRVVTSAVETSTAVIQGARHRLEVELWHEPLLLDIDPIRIAQVVSNLLTNAAKYTPPGGDIRLAVRKQAGQALVVVSDSGIGILPEHQDAIFDMFSQVGDNGGLAQGGLGIGLSLVRQLLTLHGGAVSVDSAGAGRGSTFTAYLPLGAYPGDGQEAAPMPDQRAFARRSFRILVVDDNTDAAESLSLLLRLNAHEIRTATNGRDALALVHDFTPDIAFLDIGMPGMSGYELASRLRAMPELARTAIVAVTGWGSEDDQLRAREAGFDHHFTKPIAAEQVSRLLGQLG